METKAQTRYVGSLTALSADIAVWKMSGKKDEGQAWKAARVADYLDRDLRRKTSYEKDFDIERLPVSIIGLAELVYDVEITTGGGVPSFFCESGTHRFGHD
jgi:hypothetical protein